MINSLPVFYFRPLIVCIDDDNITIDALSKLLRKKFKVKTFLKSIDLLNYLKGYTSYFSGRNLLKSFNESEHIDSPFKTLVEFNFKELTELFSGVDKIDEISVAIIDYYMPGIDGIELCTQLVELPFKKVVLTGSGDYLMAVKAFDEEIIDRFINKSIVPEKVTYTIEELSFKYFNDLTHSLRQHLEAEKKLPLSDKVFVKYFMEIFNKLLIKAYYLNDKNGSLVLIDKDNHHYNLIVHTENSLTQILRIIKDEDGFDDVYDAIKNKQKIPVNIFDKDQINLLELRNNLVSPQVLIGRDTYYTYLEKIN